MAVNPDQFPTTVEFFKRLPDSITNFPLFQQLVAYIQIKTSSTRVDIEQVLWALDELRRDLKGIGEGSSVIGYCLSENNIVTTGGNLKFGQFKLAVETLLKHSNWLTSEVNKLVYELYAYDPANSELQYNWIPMLTELWDLSDSLNIFTTNYDGVIESALGAVAMRNGELDEYLGLSGARRKYVNLDSWIQPKTRSKGLLTKLHGSVDWKRNGNTINISDAGFSGDHERHPIIYPGFKGIATTEFFQVFHRYLGDCIGSANALIFIGFAFRDEHINSVIRDRLRDSAKVIIIDIDPKVEFCSARVDPVRITEFNRKGIANVQKVISPLIKTGKGRVQLV